MPSLKPSDSHPWKSQEARAHDDPVRGTPWDSEIPACRPARTLDTALLDHLRKQAANPDLGQIACFAKHNLKQCDSEPPPTVEEELTSLAKQKQVLDWRQFVSEVRAEGQAFDAWGKAAKAWRENRDQACYERNLADNNALELAVEAAAKLCFPVLLTDSLVGSAT